MKSTLQLRSRLAFGGEILAQPATFLPVASAGLSTNDEIYTPASLRLAGFSTVLQFNGKNLTVAQPLLKEDLR